MSERDIFLTALDIEDAAARLAYLGEACGEDERLRERVNALLASHTDAGEFLDVPAVKQIATTSDSDADPTKQLGGASQPDGLAATELLNRDRTDDIPLNFLEPPTREGALGRLGHYEVLECLGRGAFGIVLKAFDESLQRVVAVKVLSPELATTSPARKRFLREALAAAKVRHENVVQIYAVAEQPLPFLVMEFIPGETLQDRLDRTGPLELPDVLRIGHQIARGLAAAHEQGLIHRDIKPGNILLESGPEERVKITDFGLARAADDASLTQSGFVAGTPMFMAPEQARGESIDQRADLFSLGSVLYTMVSGRPPFRASNTVAVLKRVCDDTPRPIPELIPETPAWLIAIIEKLHAKQPEDRFQSATEVAELLASHLAHLQHPGVVPLPSSVAAPPRRRPSRFRRRTQWLAAAVLLAALGGLGLSDAAGVTHVAEFIATVLRIQTPEGTLLVEVDDPQVQITIEGDGGIRITGAGPQEVHLQPGRYHVEASKDGTPFKDELVTIERGGERVVRVSRESPSVRLGTIPATEQPFVVLGGNGVPERKFDTLAEAVVGTNDGDTIEVRGNGPFDTPQIIIDHPLTIRAGTGFEPVIRLAAEVFRAESLISTDAPLVLEGLEFQRLWQYDEPHPSPWRKVIWTSKALHVANCRFRTRFIETQIRATEIGQTTFRNCEFLAPPMFSSTDGSGSYTEAVHLWPGRGLVIDNCLLTTTIYTSRELGEPAGGVYRLTRNTCVSPRAILAFNIRAAGGDAKSFAEEASAVRAFEVQASDNVFDATNATFVFGQNANVVVPPGEAEQLLARMAGWQGERNVYTGEEAFLKLIRVGPTADLPPANLLPGLDGWKQLWGSDEVGSVVGEIRFRGGNLSAKADIALEKLTPDDFRLRPDSAGYHAGPDGRDLGADVDLVGPGAAYERWKQTPDYQQWLEETGQRHASRESVSEPGAFVRLAGNGVPERKFDTLAEAVVGTNDGDTIEIRGNGPFVTEPISITHALTVRAAAGFRPVIEPSPLGSVARVTMINASAPLVLEGLELRPLDPGQAPDAFFITLHASKPLYVANCRFLTRQNSYPIDGPFVGLIDLRNCEFLGLPGLGCSITSWDRQLVMDNCCLVNCSLTTRVGQPRTFRLTRNTLQGRGTIGITDKWTDSAKSDGTTKSLQMEASDNIFDAGRILLVQWDTPLAPGEVEGLLPRMVGWQGERNAYTPERFLALQQLAANQWTYHPTRLPPGLAGWKQLWGSAEEGSVEGQVRFQGGDLSAKAGLALETLTPDDFRLRPDSAGYHAGPDGRDLGADVDLVGPGAAYERWKQTPDYQQWLEETGQRHASRESVSEPGAFVRLGGNGVPERKFDTLAEAVVGTNDGDTIEVHGNGPFDTPQIIIDHSLTIRAGTGFEPVIRLAEEVFRAESLISTNAPLVLEGLEFQRLWQYDEPHPSPWRKVIWTSNALHVANCRFRTRFIKTQIRATEIGQTTFRNCEFLTTPGMHSINVWPGRSFVLDNCLLTASIHMARDLGEPQGAVYRLTHNSWASDRYVIQFHIAAQGGDAHSFLEDNPTVKAIEVQASDNVFEVTTATFAFVQSVKTVAPPGEAEPLLAQIVGWQGERNVYGDEQFFLKLFTSPGDLPPPILPVGLAGWKQLWGSDEVGSVVGEIRFVGGNLSAKADIALEKLTPEDFRLRPDSAGYQAGSDGKDLGADVDLVGPGAAYERWKATPEYQVWLEESGQMTRHSAAEAAHASDRRETPAEDKGGNEE